jgi:triosephosphate isomerase
MTNKKKLIVANWKMHLNVQESSLLVHRLSERIRIHRDVEVVLAPSLLALQPLSVQIDRRKFKLAAQNAYFQDEGAFTGEVSFAMLQDIVHYVIVGHSERRLIFKEELDMVRDKVAAALRNDISPILCIGETKQEHDEGESRQVLHDQITTGLGNVTAEEIDDIVLVYEPQWTITTFNGRPAKPHEAKSAMDFIRQQVSDLYGSHAGQNVRVLYGGSVNEESVRAYLELEGCDGVLVGGAGLNYVKFASIVDKAYRLQRSGDVSNDV